MIYQLFQGKWEELNWHDTKKVRVKIDTIEILETKLRYNVKNKNQLCNLLIDIGYQS